MCSIINLSTHQLLSEIEVKLFKFLQKQQVNNCSCDFCVEVIYPLLTTITKIKQIDYGNLDTDSLIHSFCGSKCTGVLPNVFELPKEIYDCINCTSGDEIIKCLEIIRKFYKNVSSYLKSLRS